MTDCMYVEPPATVAVLGAGPIGLEAALYARFLGYSVKLFERGSVADNVQRWAHVRMFSPFRMNASPLGLKALAAQDDGYQPPEPDALLTAGQWVEQYLLPLSRSDLIVDGLCEQTRVMGISRHECCKGELVGNEHRAESPFRILLEDKDGQRDETAEVVIDTTGVFGNHNWLGRGGLPAIGEMAAARAIDYGLPDILGAAREKFLARRTLVVGTGYSAATNIVALAELASSDANTKFTWITRPRDGAPLARIVDDRLPSRDELAKQANALSTGEGPLVHLPGARVEAINYDANHLGEAQARFKVKLSDDSGQSEHEFDNILANVGYRPDASLYAELQVHQCYATDGPMKLAAELMGQTSVDCLDQTSLGPQSLLNPEPNFYILGSKSYGRNSNFLISIGLEQIRDAFSIIGDREDLDLYATMKVQAS